MSSILQPSGADDTAAILAAYTKYGGVELDDGAFTYNGPGLSGTSYFIEGRGPGRTIVNLGPNSYLMATASRIDQLDLEGVHFEGGLGAIHFTNPSYNVTNHFHIDKCRFRNYTQTAIGHCASDMPYWKISRSIFYGADSISTMGIALSGNTDQSSITDCSFLRNKVHIKAGLGGDNLNIDKCDTLQFDKGTGRVMIWVVPNPSWVNAGSGFLVTAHKFGGENLDASDYRILYADESPGADFTTRLPNLSADSAGFISGHTVRNSMIGGVTGNGPFVYTTTPNVRASSYGHCVIDGSTPRYLVEYRTPPKDRHFLRNTSDPSNGTVARRR